MSENEKLRYNLVQVPPVPLLISGALQHILMSLAGSLATSFIVSDILCIASDSTLRTRLFSSTMFMCGICTVFQTLLGLRLPVFQGPSSSFLPALLAVKNNVEWACASSEAMADGGGHNMTTLLFSNITESSHAMTEEEKLRKLSGSLMAASFIEIFVGGTGLIGTLLRYIGPITVAPTISLIGFSIYKVPIIYSRPSWEIAISGAVLVLLFTLYLNTVEIPLPSCRKDRDGQRKSRLRLFQLLPILLSIIVTWGICGVLTYTNVFPNDPNSLRFRARTDAKVSLLKQTPWFIFPYPGQFGTPGFSVAVVIGFCAAFCASMIESVGDYFAAAKACEVETPPNHAVNRGILAEGLGGLLSGAVGVGHATTSYSGNIAALSVSKTASRSVLVCAGVIQVCCAIIGKFGAAIATIPDPALGGVMIVICGMLVSLGLSTLRYVNLYASRNLSILGVALFVGIFLPEWLDRHPDFINTGNLDADGVLKVALGTPMFLGGVIAMILDNTVRGSLQDRGILKWRHNVEDEGDSEEGEDSDQIPSSVAYGWSCLPSLYNRFRFLAMLPFMPPVDHTFSEANKEFILIDKNEKV